MNTSFKQVAEHALTDAEFFCRALLPDGKREGLEYVARNPTRDDVHAGSFKINLVTGLWADFATDAKGGDLISLMAYICGIRQVDAARGLAGCYGLPWSGRCAPSKRPAVATLTKCHTSPPKPLGEAWKGADTLPETIQHRARGIPRQIWVYRDRDGKPVQVDCRYEKLDGKKDVLAFSYIWGEWLWTAFQHSRPLYNLPEIVQDTNTPVLVAEGAKAAEAAGALFPDAVATTWAGGAYLYKRTDWTPLAGRDVVLWPDADEPGVAAMQAIREILWGMGCSVHLPTLPEGLPDGFDAADIAEGDTGRALALLCGSETTQDPAAVNPPPGGRGSLAEKTHQVDPGLPPPRIVDPLPQPGSLTDNAPTTYKPEKEHEIKIPFSDSTYDACVWRHEMGSVASIISYNTEAALSVRDSVTTFDHVLASVFEGTRVFFVTQKDFKAFWIAHQESCILTHRVGFDLGVAAKACGFDFSVMIKRRLIRDVSILFRLLGVADSGEVPEEHSPDAMCKELFEYDLGSGDMTRADLERLYNDGGITEDGALLSSPEYAPGLVWAGKKAVATFLLAEPLILRCMHIHEEHGLGEAYGLIGDEIQLKGDVAIFQMECNGLHVDLEAVQALDTRLKQEEDRYSAVLAGYGYIMGRGGNKAVFDGVIRGIEAERSITLPCTANGLHKSQKAQDLAPVANHPFVEAFLGFKDIAMRRKSYLAKMVDPVIYPRYGLMGTTGRATCSDPNIQSIPREGGIRECFVPSPGYVFIGCDYSSLELSTLARTTYLLYSKSEMRDLINRDVDLHRYVVAMVLHKAESDVTPEERQKAKAINFGLPGGMGGGRLREYAAQSYGVEITLEEAAQWRSEWFKLFPEVEEYLRGKRLQGPTAGTATRCGSSDKQSALDRNRVVTIPTGRVRAGCSYTESCNWPFQALAADGAKLALCDLTQAGFRVVAFIHDEVLVEVPEAPDYRVVAEDISRIMVNAMREVCPDVDIRTEYAVMRCWSKHAKAVYDAQGHLIPFEDGGLL